MRCFSITLAIFSLMVGASAEVSNNNNSNLRGSSESKEVQQTNRFRDLLSIFTSPRSSSYSKSKDFTFNCCYSGGACFDAQAWCLAYANTDTAVATAGNSAAESAFLAAALCGALASAHACSYACVKAKGKINLKCNPDTWNGMEYGLSMKLDTATLTVAKANTTAEATAAAGVAGMVYTTTDTDYCSNGGWRQRDPQCARNSTGFKAIANVSAGALGDATAISDAVGSSGTSTSLSSWVDAKGPSINEVSAQVTAVASSWAFAAAEAATFAATLATAVGDAAAVSAQCSKAYSDKCGTGDCGYKDEQEACDAAIAFAKGEAVAYSTACASASASIFAETKVIVNFGGRVGGFKNDGNPMTLDFGTGTNYAMGAAATICPRK